MEVICLCIGDELGLSGVKNIDRFNGMALDAPAETKKRQLGCRTP
jgi:hypothetical protein